MSEPIGVKVVSEVVCIGPDGKVKWRDGTTTHRTFKELGVTNIAEAEALFKPQVFHVGGTNK